MATLRAETLPPKLMTTEEAAKALGLPSAIIIKHWARIGQLGGYLGKILSRFRRSTHTPYHRCHQLVRLPARY